MIRRFLATTCAAALALCMVLPAHAAAPTQFSANAAEVRDFLAVSSSVGFAATVNGGLWKTGDAGATWTKTSLPAFGVWKIAANANSAGARLYAASDQGLFRSTDGGTTWTQLTQDPTRAVAVDPGSASGGPDTILIGVKGAGVLKSTDSGTTIVRQSSGLDSTDVIGLAYYPGQSAIAYAVLQCDVADTPPPLSGNWGGVYRTANANAATPAWSVMNGGLPAVDSTVPCVNAIAANGSSVIVGIKNVSNLQGGIYLVTSSGTTTWTLASSSGSGAPYGVEWLGADFSSTSGFFIGSNQFGPWRSTDGGNTFIQVGGAAPLTTSLAYAAGAFSASTWVADINGLGLFRTTGGQSGWGTQPAPLKADRVNDLTNHAVALPSTYYMALKDGGIMKSLDSGSTWSQFDFGIANPIIKDAQVVAAHPNNGSVVGMSIRAFGLYQLAGGSWSAVAGFNGGVDHKPQSLVITPGGTVYYTLFDANAATPGGGFRATATSTTIGTLTSIGKPIYDAAPQLGVANGAGRVRVMPSNESNVYMMVWGSLPYHSNDAGTTWARVNVPANGTREFAFQPHSFFDVTEKPSNTAVVVGATNRGIYRSSDGGANFSYVAATGLTQQSLAAMVYGGNSVLFGGDFSGQLWCSTDDGSTWQAVSGGNLGAPIRDIKLLNGTLHVLTDGAGFWKKDTVCP